VQYVSQEILVPVATNPRGSPLIGQARLTAPMAMTQSMTTTFLEKCATTSPTRPRRCSEGGFSLTAASHPRMSAPAPTSLPVAPVHTVQRRSSAPTVSSRASSLGPEATLETAPIPMSNQYVHRRTGSSFDIDVAPDTVTSPPTSVRVLHPRWTPLPVQVLHSAGSSMDIDVATDPTSPTGRLVARRMSAPSVAMFGPIRETSFDVVRQQLLQHQKIIQAQRQATRPAPQAATRLPMAEGVISPRMPVPPLHVAGQPNLHVTAAHGSLATLQPHEPQQVPQPQQMQQPPQPQPQPHMQPPQMSQLQLPQSPPQLQSQPQSAHLQQSHAQQLTQQPQQPHQRYVTRVVSGPVRPLVDLP